MLLQMNRQYRECEKAFLQESLNVGAVDTIEMMVIENNTGGEFLLMLDRILCSANEKLADCVIHEDVIHNLINMASAIIERGDDWNKPECEA